MAPRQISSSMGMFFVLNGSMAGAVWRWLDGSSLRRLVEALGAAQDFLLAANDPPVHIKPEVAELRLPGPEKLGAATAGRRGVAGADADPTEGGRQLSQLVEERR